jgi:carbonic anhydrase
MERGKAERVKDGTLNLNAGYYYFVDCTFEKWTLVYPPGLEGGSKYAIKILKRRRRTALLY